MLKRYFSLITHCINNYHRIPVNCLTASQEKKNLRTLIKDEFQDSQTDVSSYLQYQSTVYSFWSQNTAFTKLCASCSAHLIDFNIDFLTIQAVERVLHKEARKIYAWLKVHKNPIFSTMLTDIHWNMANNDLHADLWSLKICSCTRSNKSTHTALRALWIVLVVTVLATEVTIILVVQQSISV